MESSTQPSITAAAAPAASASAYAVPAGAVGRDSVASARLVRRQRAALGAVLALAALLDVVRLDRQGDGNLYYAAAVRSMLESWHNFVFVSFDPGGFVTIDKPPLGFWLQTASAKLFGFHGLSLLLPQAIAGVLSVALLYALVRRAFGVTAGLLAALALAVTPINVAANRDNTVDTLLVLAVLAAAWAVTRAVETGRLRWLLLGFALVGLGFNIKMLEAYLVLPALYLVALIAPRVRWRVRIAHLAAATAVLLVVSFAWAVAVDLTPAADRPYVGSSQNNSELNLIFGYNGLNRVLPRSINLFGLTIGQSRGFGRRPTVAVDRPEATATRGPTVPGIGFAAGENGGRGLLRLFNSQLAGQLSWLLPLALLGLLAAAWQTRPRLPLNRRETGLLLWGAWLLTVGAFFSYTNQFHAYYTVMLTPAIAACAGFGLVALWRGYRRPGWRGWLLPAAIAITAAVQVHVLDGYPDWRARLGPAIIALAVVAVAGLIGWRLMRAVEVKRFVWWRRLRAGSVKLPLALAAAGSLALLIAPTTWAAYTTWNTSQGMMPSAGPPHVAVGRGGFGGARAVAAFGDRQGRFGGFGDEGGALDPQLLSYLETHRGNARFLVGVPNAMTASPIVIATGQPVMALGGFTGSDPILTSDDLARLVANGTIRYFLMPGGGAFARGSGSPPDFAPQGDAADRPAFDFGGGTDRPALDVEGGADRPTGAPGGFGRGFVDQNTSWVTDHCTVVPDSAWQTGSGSTTSGFGRMLATLYDCGNARMAGGG